MVDSNEIRIDPKQSWYQKIKFQFLSSLTIHQNKEAEKAALEIGSYFYSGWSSEITNLPKIKERFFANENQWKVVEPKKDT